MNDVNCTLTESEISAIRDLFEKKIALENLAKVISPRENLEMYEHLLADYGSTVKKFNDWWAVTIKRHGLLPSIEYIVDFDNNQLIAKN